MHEPIIIVHGTFASADTWWRRGSDFCAALDGALATLASPAKSWGSERQCPVEFSWSGLNSDRARAQAAQALGEYVNDLVAPVEVSRIHFVCHSHGGNVILQASEHLAPRAKIAVGRGMKVFLGTPFYHYDSHPTIGRVPLAEELALFLNLSILGLLAMFHESLPTFVSIMLLVLLAPGAVILAAKFLSVPFFVDRGEKAQWESAVFQARNTIFSFAADEALAALQVARSHWHRPQLSVQGSTFGKWQGRFSHGKIAYYWQSMRYFSAYSNPSNSEIALAPDNKLNFFTYLSDEIRSLIAPGDFSDGAYEFLFDVLWRVMLLVCFPIAVTILVLRLLILILIDAVLSGAAAWLSPIMLRLAIRLGLRASATMALGLDRVGQIVAAVERVPPSDVTTGPMIYPGDNEVDWHVVPIPKRVDRDVNRQAIKQFRTILNSVYASREKELDWLEPRLEHVSEIFSGVQFTHNMYYRHPWVIDRIAAAIAEPFEDVHPALFLSGHVREMSRVLQDAYLIALLRE